MNKTRLLCAALLLAALLAGCGQQKAPDAEQAAETALPRYLTDVQEDGKALQFDGARKRYILTEEFDEDKLNGYSKFKVFWMKRKK